jgi:hypothetical protein
VARQSGLKVSRWDPHSFEIFISGSSLKSTASAMTFQHVEGTIVVRFFGSDGAGRELLQCAFSKCLIAASLFTIEATLISRQGKLNFSKQGPILVVIPGMAGRVETGLTPWCVSWCRRGSPQDPLRARRPPRSTRSRGIFGSKHG